MTAPRILALDLSLTATGVASNAGDGWATTIRPPRIVDGVARIDHLRRAIAVDYLPAAEYVVVEGLPFGSHDAYAKETAGLFYVVAVALYRRGIPMAAVNPTTLKSYVCKGNASKDEMRGEVVARFPNFRGDHNAADALALCAMACEHFGDILGAYGFPNPAAVGRVQWPDRPGVLSA